MKQVIGFIVSGFILILVLYGVYSFVGVPVGEFIDWLVGILALMWLFLIVTVPWNAHFRAREIVDEARISKLKNIQVAESSLEFAEGVVKRSLWLAIGLHIVSAIGLYLIASSGVSQVGYFAAILALLLTLLRPAVRMYEYIQARLNTIREEFRYPREDINLLLDDIARIKDKTAELDAVLTTEHNKSSWRKEMDIFVGKTNETLLKIKEQAEANKNENAAKLQATAQQLLEQLQVLEKMHRTDMERIAVDSHILDSVRTLAAFVKEMRE